jgi:hypothetical protein
MIREFLGRNKRRYARGVEYTSILLLVSANAKLFEDFFRIHFGIDIIGAFLIIGVLFIFGCWILGFLDEQYGIWREENDHSIAVTPKLETLCQNVDQIKKILEGK